MLQQLLNEEIAKLYMELLERSVKDKYRGHQDYGLIMDKIRADFPFVGGDIKVQKEDGNGNFYTVTYQVAVFDDLGNPIYGISDIGGRCRKGEIVKKGFIFTCKKCGKNFCREHVEFVDDDETKPLCRYGFIGWEGCYQRYKGSYEDGVTDIERKTRKLRALEEQHIAEHREKAAREGRLISRTGEQEVPMKSKPGLLDRFLHGSAYTVRCGHCNHLIGLNDIVCPRCRKIITIPRDGSLRCPHCGTSIDQVDCPQCSATNQL